MMPLNLLHSQCDSISIHYLIIPLNLWWYNTNLIHKTTIRYLTITSNQLLYNMIQFNLKGNDSLFETAESAVAQYDSISTQKATIWCLMIPLNLILIRKATVQNLTMPVNLLWCSMIQFWFTEPVIMQYNSISIHKAMICEYDAIWHNMIRFRFQSIGHQRSSESVLGLCLFR